MADANELNSLDFIIKIPHDFEVDLNSVVMLGHRFALEGIDRAQDEDIRKEELSQEDYETEQNAINLVLQECEQLRNAVNLLALVGVVARLDHKIAEFVKELPEKPDKNTNRGFIRQCVARFVEKLRKQRVKSAGGGLIRQLKLLDSRLGRGPVPISFFQCLVDVRDSTIHANSQAKWKYGGKDREIAACYSNPYQSVQLSKEQVQEAASKAIEQVSWYSGKLHPQVSIKASR